MATSEGPAPESGPPHESSTPSLDTTKLHALPSEQQDLYILSFTSSLARLVANFTADEASAHQVYVKKELFKIITLSSPAPTRVVRNDLARTFAAIFSKGDRKLLFESINELVALASGAGKVDNKEIKSKHAAVVCLGAVFEAAGDSAHSLSILGVTTLTKALKAVQTHSGFRAAAFKTVGQIFKGVAPSAEEPIAKEAWRAARNAAANDKSYLVQTAACGCLEQLVKYTGHFDNSSDFEKLQNAVYKAMDSSSPSVRHAAAKALAAALVKSYSDSPVEALPKIKSRSGDARRQWVRETTMRQVEAKVQLPRSLSRN